MRNFRIVVHMGSVGVAMACGLASAQTTSANSTANLNLPKDNVDLIGDNLHFEVDAPLSSDAGAVCLRRGDKVKVIGLKGKDALFLRFNADREPGQGRCPIENGAVITDRPEERMRYELSVSNLETLGAHRSGWTYGMLMVPFKYVISSDRGMRGASTVGGYMGWRQTPVLGMEYSYIGFVGATVISVHKTENGETKQTDNAGLSAGFGVITKVKGAFQVGGVIGWDMVSRDAGYAANYKPWVSLQIGYSFLQ